MTEDIIRTLTAERSFLEEQNRKLSTLLFEKEKLIADLQTANQDLKFQLIQLHREIYGTEH
jgi:hypothetical protein